MSWAVKIEALAALKDKNVIVVDPSRDYNKLLGKALASVESDGSERR